MPSRFEPDKCSDCGSCHIRLPEKPDGYPRSAEEAWGKCLDCGAVLCWEAAPVVGTTYQTSDEIPTKLGVAPVSISTKTLGSLSGCSKTDLEEISVAVELLMEYPVAKEHVSEFRAAVKSVLASRK